jgi:hypothetical protein
MVWVWFPPQHESSPKNIYNDSHSVIFCSSGEQASNRAAQGFDMVCCCLLFYICHLALTGYYEHPYQCYFRRRGNVGSYREALGSCQWYMTEWTLSVLMNTKGNNINVASNSALRIIIHLATPKYRDGTGYPRITCKIVPPA